MAFRDFIPESMVVRRYLPSLGKDASQFSVDRRSRWQELCKLLERGNYDRVDELLCEFHEAAKKTDHPDLVNIFAAARQICLACIQCRAEVERNRRAYQEADQNERQLRKQLQTILSLVSGCDQFQDLGGMEQLPDIPDEMEALEEFSPPKSFKQPGIWQRIQKIISLESFSKSPEQQPLSGAKTGEFTELIEQVDPIVASSETQTTTISFLKEEEKTQQSVPSLVVYCLGPFRVYQNDQLITEWQSLKSQAIFKYLLANSEMPVPKNILMDIFWPDATPDAARRNLHQAIYSLRKQMRAEQKDLQHIRFENDRYFLNPEIDIWLDYKEFEQHVKAGRSLETAGHQLEAIGEFGIAEGLYQGEFLEEDMYEDWISSQRQHFYSMYVNITDRLSLYYLQQGEYITAIALCRKLLERDSCHEGAHRRLMKCYLAQGQRHLAIRQYQICVASLLKELDIEPAANTIALYESLR